MTYQNDESVYASYDQGASAEDRASQSLISKPSTEITRYRKDVDAMERCAHARNMFYFEALLMLIIVLWLVKWLICEPISMKSYSGGFNYE